jgi:uncharacterized protein
MTAAGKPVPVANPLTAAYWNGAQRHELVLQRCEDCQFYIHPPKSTCPRCQSEAVVPCRVSGNGVVYSFSVMHNRGNPGFDDELPFAIVIVHLDEQPGLKALGNLLECDPDDVYITMAVEVRFEDRGGGVVLPQFRPRL